MKYKFNKEKFQRTAPSNVKTRLKYLLDDLENLEVDFSENANHGTLIIDLYGIRNEVYPIYKEWCIIEEQLRFENLN